MNGIAPSILAADYSRLGSQLDDVLGAGATVIHVDVMDGHFVPPITIGPLIVSSIKEQVAAAGAKLDVHLMIEQPERQIEAFAKAGADSITFHEEATAHAHRLVQQIREAGCGAGVAINPGTPPETLSELAALVDIALCMTVNPGWGGQPFIESSPAKIARLAGMGDWTVEVDGGVDERTAPLCHKAGATLFVAGSAVFGAPEPAEAFRRLAQAVSG